MCGHYLYFHPLISCSCVFNIVQGVGSIMHVEAELHFLVVGPTKCDIAAFQWGVSWDPCSPLQPPLPHCHTLPLRRTFSLHHKSLLLCGSLVGTEFPLVSSAAPQSTWNFLSPYTSMGVLTWKHMKKAVPGPLPVLRGVGWMCGKKSIRLEKNI